MLIGSIKNPSWFTPAPATWPLIPIELVVTNLDDAGPGSLRDAIDQANASTSGANITFQGGLAGDIVLTTGQLRILKATQITGPGSGVIAVSGNNASRVFYLYSGPTNPDAGGFPAVTISGLTLKEGQPGAGEGIHGGALVNWSMRLTLTDVVVRDSAAPGAGATGGGIRNNATLEMSSCTITGNTVDRDGGGVYTRNLWINSRTLITDTTIEGNTAGQSAGGVWARFSLYGTGDCRIEDTTISGNAAVEGGGVYSFGYNNGALVLENCTIAGNSASGAGNAGGGVFIGGDSSAASNTISLSTIAANDAPAGSGGGLAVRAGEPAANTTLRNSIVGNNTANAAPDISGAVHADYTLIEDATGATITGGNNITGSDPQLGVLQNNGGLTETMLPAGGSPVIDAGDPAFTPPPATDQRGLPRVVGGALDMGSVEVQ